MEATPLVLVIVLVLDFLSVFEGRERGDDEEIWKLRMLETGTLWRAYDGQQRGKDSVMPPGSVTNYRRRPKPIRRWPERRAGQPAKA